MFNRVTHSCCIYFISLFPYKIVNEDGRWDSFPSLGAHAGPQCCRSCWFGHWKWGLMFRITQVVISRKMLDF